MIFIGLIIGVYFGFVMAALLAAAGWADNEYEEAGMYQKLIIIGRLGRDPEMRFTPTGAAVTTFSIATDRQWMENDQLKKETTWFRVTVWNKLAESCDKYLQKGKMVMVEGRLITDPKTGGPRIWEGRDDHVAHTGFEVVALGVKFLSGKNENEGKPAEEAQDYNSEEIPF